MNLPRFRGKHHPAIFPIYRTAISLVFAGLAFPQLTEKLPQHLSAFGFQYPALCLRLMIIRQLEQIHYPAQTGYYNAAAEIAPRLLALAT